MRSNNDRLRQALPALILAAAAIGCWEGKPIGQDHSETEPTPIYSANSNSMNKNSNANADNRSDKPEEKKRGFEANLPSGFEQPTDDAAKLLLREYGAVFMARGGATAPKKVVFRDQADVAAFQSSLKTSTETVGGVRLELQAAAMADLLKAVDEAKAAGLSITPRAADSAKRDYDQTVGLWKSRVDPALDHWSKLGKITAADAARIRSLSPYEQVSEVLKLEAKGIWFSKDLSKSIIYSVAPPGTSQHISMLALDINENGDARVRAILAKHNWYQTVESDLPHFTYLGVPEGDLASLGLAKRESGGRTFWVPDLGS